MRQPEYLLENGTQVVTHQVLESPRGMMVSKSYLDARTGGVNGKIIGVVGGHGGDVYFVEHLGGRVGVYCFSEFELA